MTRLASPQRGAGVLWALLALCVGPGCVTVYQPLSSLQRPTVVDPQIANFEGVRMRVRCHPGDYLNASDAQQLCRGVGTSFRNQGAQVDIEIPRPNRPSTGRDEEGPADLVVDLKSRLLHKEDSNLLWILSYVTLTIVPAVEEYSFAQDVTIRDRDGSLLLSDSLQARFVRYFGAGVWVVNWVLDLAVRPEEDKLSGNRASEDFSRDFYGQLSQLAFNAQVRQTVLRGFEPATPPTPPLNDPDREK